MKYMILSVDTGIDDALALAYAVGQTEYVLLGVTVSYGMAPLEKTYRNTKHVLKLLHKENIPVFPGSRVPVREKRTYNGNFHGMDGAADLLGDPCPEEFPQPDEMDAVSFILESVRKYGRELVLVTTGPLTDLAAAICREPELMHTIGKVVSMGGALTCPGNSSPYAEANLKADPDSSRIVVSAGLPLTLIGLDVTRKTLLTREDIGCWNTWHTPASEYFYKLLSFYIKEYQRFYPYLAGCALHDPLAVAAACCPELVRTMPFHLTVSLEEADKGRLTEDLRQMDGPETTQVALKVNSRKFKQLFTDIMTDLLSSYSPASQTLYLAGPMLFYPNGSSLLSQYAAACREMGLVLPQGTTPLLEDDTPLLRAYKHRIRCLESLDASQTILACLTPFRGLQPDSGTLFELGYAYGKGKKCYLFCEQTAPWMNRKGLSDSFKSALETVSLKSGDYFQEMERTESESDDGCCLILSHNFSLKTEWSEDAKAPVFWFPIHDTPSGADILEQLFPQNIRTAASRCSRAVIDLSFPHGCQEPSAQAAFLCGYLYARDIPFTAVSDDLRPLTEKLDASFCPDRNCWVDSDGNMVENFTLPVNLMLGTTARKFTQIPGAEAHNKA